MCVKQQYALTEFLFQHGGGVVVRKIKNKGLSLTYLVEHEANVAKGCRSLGVILPHCPIKVKIYSAISKRLRQGGHSVLCMCL